MKTSTRRLFLLGGASTAFSFLYAWRARRRRYRAAQKEENMKTTELRPIALVREPGGKHWVGDGFFVHSAFSPFSVDPEIISPFLLLDHAAPKYFPPSSRPRGVGEHPHRGFETVTFAYQGEIEHRDSHGGGGVIGPGDVQWMTAASGVVHEEFQSQSFTESGGTAEMVQLWVNLPADQKMSEPAYQNLTASMFPSFSVGDASGRLVAGEFAGEKGPAQTHTPMTLFDLEFKGPGEAQFSLPVRKTAMVFALGGKGQIQQGTLLSEGTLVILDRETEGTIRLSADSSLRVLVLSGQPLGEPVVAHGPFVMNSKEEIIQAMRDYQAGQMGSLSPKEMVVNHG